jgi:hypothetical protein
MPDVIPAVLDKYSAMTGYAVRFATAIEHVQSNDLDALTAVLLNTTVLPQDMYSVQVSTVNIFAY